jgi:hypothetical protein
MRRRTSLGRLFGATVVGLYLLLTVPVLALTRVEWQFWWLLFAVLYECIAVSLSLELTELLFASLLPPRTHPRLSQVTDFQVRVAVLYVCCDDVDPASLSALKGFSSADVFVLDDSASVHHKRLVDSIGLRVIRRGSRAGFKAGNLNYWLSHFGALYDYFAVLDSDSLMTEDAVAELTAYAEHPDNNDVAIVQSQILPRVGNRFQRAVSCTTGARLQVTSRVHDRIGWTISYGHNNLHRTRAIVAIGGFDTSTSCEDTLVSLELRRRGWRLIQVPTQSLDSEPSNVTSYRRRHLRWARQTLEAVMVSRCGIPSSLTLLLARHVLSYLLPCVCVAMLGMVVFLSPPIDIADAWSAMARNYALAPGHLWAGVSSYLVLGAYLTTTVLRLRLAVRTGAGIGGFLTSSLTGGALAAFCGLHAAAAMMRSLIGSRVALNPTGAGAARPSSLRSIAAQIAVPWALYALIAGRLLTNPGLSIFGLNVLWAALLVGSPLWLWLTDSDRGGSNATVSQEAQGLPVVLPRGPRP